MRGGWLSRVEDRDAGVDYEYPCGIGIVLIRKIFKGMGLQSNRKLLGFKTWAFFSFLYGGYGKNSVLP